MNDTMNAPTLMAVANTAVRPMPIDHLEVPLGRSWLHVSACDSSTAGSIYYRLAQHTLLVPPLRDRREDIPTLIDHFTGQYCKAESKSIGGFSRTAHDELEKYSWPGNVRQLRNEIHRLVTLADDGEVIGVELLSQAIRLGESGSEGAPSAESIVCSPESERQRLIQLLDRNNWNKSMTARDLGITWQGLWWRMKKLAIRKETES